ncbi:Protein kinase domain [Carpediemonas membranifera]|uniref:Protein kinase domain n=1 Tax=Carpediemonas membranifera TaxID=201153 RepID=A0A8J6DZB1_9EUKA|nr:Protein kinase domain [Carpediemonas membranifera]|eukprot:KAG9390473.1 Protein kinase domain [Carpediemonas membranifera]
MDALERSIIIRPNRSMLSMDESPFPTAPPSPETESALLPLSSFGDHRVMQYSTSYERTVSTVAYHCPVCGQRTSRPINPMDADQYWMNLEMHVPRQPYYAIEGDMDDEDTPYDVPDTDGLHDLSAASLNNGYYSTFFTNETLIGRGSFGSVYRVTHRLGDIELGTYAVKRVPVGDSRPWLLRVLREVHALETLRHPNVVDYHHSWLETYSDGPACPSVPHLFLLLDYAAGGSLTSFVEAMQRGDLVVPAQVVAEMCTGMVNGLAHLHSVNVLHRDLKPENILLLSSVDEAQATWDTPIPVVPRPQLADFGQCGDVEALPADGQTGTMEFMAPEKIFDAELPWTEAMDVYSLGLTLFYLVTAGGLPERQLRALRAVHVPCDHFIGSAPVVSNHLIAVIERCVAEDPAERPSAREVARLLSEKHPGLSVSSEASSGAHSTRRMVFAGAVGVGLGFGLAAGRIVFR